MSRWLLIPLALAVAAGAWFALSGDGPGLSRAPGPLPHDEIDEASRLRLEQVLEAADPVSADPDDADRGGAP